MQAIERKQELIQIAFQQFLSRGYDKTSIRSIVQDAGGEIGMFYHYFQSKDDIYREVLQQYHDQYIAKFLEKLELLKTKNIHELFDEMLDELERVIVNYQNMNESFKEEKCRKELHEKSLEAIEPILKEVLVYYQNEGVIQGPIENMDYLVSFLLYGVSAVLHTNKDTSYSDKKQAIRTLIDKLLGV